MTEPNKEQPDPNQVPEAIPVDPPFGEPVGGEGDSSILFEATEIVPNAGPGDPFGNLPDPTSGASFAAPWDKSVQQNSSHDGGTNPSLRYDSMSDQDLLHFADDEVIPVAEIVDDEQVTIADVHAGEHGSSAVPLGRSTDIPSDDPMSDVLMIDDLLITDEEEPPVAEEVTQIEELILAELIDETLEATQVSLPSSEELILAEEVDPPEPERPTYLTQSSVLDLVLSEDTIGDNPSGMLFSNSPPPPSRGKQKPEADEDAFAYGDDAIDMIESDGPTTSIKITDDEALSELSLDDMPSTTPDLPTGSHVSYLVEDEWQSGKSDSQSGDTGGSVVPLMGELSSRTNVESSAIDLGTDPSGDFMMEDEPIDVISEADDDDEVGTIDVTSTMDDFQMDDVDAPVSESTEVESTQAEDKWESRAKKKVPKSESRPTPSQGDIPAPAKGSGLLMGTMLGTLLGALAVTGAWFGGLLPSDSKAVVSDSKNGQGSQQLITPNPSITPAVTPEAGRKLLDAGDLTGALAMFEKCDAMDAKVLLGRGQARWLAYLQESAQKKALLDANAETVLEAKKDLTAAAALNEGDTEPVAAHAKLWLGLMAESLGNLDEAKIVYQEGESTFSNHQKLFQAGLNRVELQSTPKVPEIPKDISALPSHEALIGFLILIQAEPMAETEEAGFKFWEALVFARRHQYAEATRALIVARELHDRRRIEAPGKRLNPTSDPLDQIFLRSCDELLVFWKIRENLYSNPMIATLVKEKGYDAVIKDLMANPALPNAVVLHLKAEKLDGKPAPEVIDELIKTRKLSGDLVTKFTADLKDAGFDEPKVEDSLAKVLLANKTSDDTLKAIAKTLKDGGIDEPDASKAVAIVVAIRKELDTTIASVTDRLATGKFVEGLIDREKLLAGVDAAIGKANTPGIAELVAPGIGLVAGAAAPSASVIQIAGKLNAANAEVKAMKLEVTKVKADSQTEIAKLVTRQEKQLLAIRTPAKTLDLWIAILSNADRKSEIPAATADASSVTADDKADPASKAKALVVTGYSARNNGDYALARKSLEMAVAHPGFAKDEPWGQEVVAVVDGLRNPGRIVKVETPKVANPLEAVEQMIKAFPAEDFAKENGQLLAKRALIKLDMNDLTGARSDAAAAINAGAIVDGHFAMGRIAEKLEDFVLAEKSYREVIKQPKADPELIKQAKFGLGRSLIEQRRPSRLLGPGAMLDRDTPSAAVVLLTLMLLQDPSLPNPKQSTAFDETLLLAEEMIRDKDYSGHFLKADVLLQMERFNDALREFALGLKMGAVPRPEQKNLLDEIVRRHPNLRKLDPIEQAETAKKAKATNNPPLALKSYNEGCMHFFEGRYVDAEQLFVRAVEFDRNDARYYYFLGLARWMQGNHGLAVNDFQTGAELELQGKPNGRTVNQSLERIQGQVRAILNRLRP